MKFGKGTLSVTDIAEKMAEIDLGVNYGGAFVEMYERKKFAINSRNIRIDEFSKRIHWNEYNHADNYENIFYVYLLPIDFIKFYKK